MNTPDTPKIVVEGLCKSFDGEAVLDGIDLSIPDGGSLVLLGESGSGKTLTLKCIMGLIRVQFLVLHLAERHVAPHGKTVEQGGLLKQHAATAQHLVPLP
ncbi:MAG: ATP-binding cassette domain-containing protein, partial [Rhodospirillaceae bacterium]|nr:ATP-binding cassette domain-containing protein [Rhodospirillaceae bacterium]